MTNRKVPCFEFKIIYSDNSSHLHIPLEVARERGHRVFEFQVLKGTPAEQAIVLFKQYFTPYPETERKEWKNSALYIEDYRLLFLARYIQV